MSLNYVKFTPGFEPFMPKEYRDMVEHGPFGKKCDRVADGELQGNPALDGLNDFLNRSSLRYSCMISSVASTSDVIAIMDCPFVGPRRDGHPFVL